MWIEHEMIPRITAISLAGVYLKTFIGSCIFIWNHGYI